MKSAVVLLSGGVDSATCLALALKQYGLNNVSALNITYGQKHVRELESAQRIADFYNVTYRLLDLSAVFAESDCSLLAHSSKSIDHTSYSQQLKASQGAAVGTYVPFRNGLMLSAAASCAQSIGASCVIYGAHADDAAGRAYPDCTPEFVQSMREAIYEGTGREIMLEAPFINCNKAEIVRRGLELRVPYDLTWSCYEGGEKPCGACGTCRDRARAFELNGVRDPLLR